MAQRGTTMNLPELPMTDLTDDEVRTIARDYVEHHGVAVVADQEDLIKHCMKILQRTRPEPIFPTHESAQRVCSVIRRSVLRAELPADIDAPATVISEDDARALAREIRSWYGEGADELVVRTTYGRNHDDELAEESVELVVELCEASEMLILLPGDAEYQPHVDLPKIDDLGGSNAVLAWSSGKMTAEEMQEKYPEMYEAIKHIVPKGE